MPQPALSFDEILGIAQAAGFSGNAAITATAIALAESSGHPDIVGDLNLPNAGPSYGLWQINSVHPGAEQAVDPAIGAKMAYDISAQGTNFRPWTTYRTGAYRRFLPAAGWTEPEPTPSSPDTPPSAPAPSGPSTGHVVATSAGLTGALAIVLQWALHWPIVAPDTNTSTALAALLAGGAAGIWHYLAQRQQE
jgi:Lysozyme like domain